MNKIFIKNTAAKYSRRTLGTIWMILSLLSVAEAQNSVSIKATAIVVGMTDIEMITISNLYIDESQAIDGMVNISPINDALAGKILIKGQPDVIMNITFINQLALVNTSGNGTLVFNYAISGYALDNQLASQILDAVNRSLRFNSDGEFYLWIGGRADISNARPGSYEGEFTLAIEYM
jgi:hypothetical protein